MRVRLDLIIAAMLAFGCAGQTAQDPVMTWVQQKAKRVETAAPAWVKAGGNPERLRPLSERVDRAMKAGQPAHRMSAAARRSWPLRKAAASS